MHDVAGDIMHHSAIGPDGLGPLHRGFMGIPVEGDGATRIIDHVFVAGKSVGDIGVGEDRPVQPPGQQFGVHAAGGFQEPREVGDLMIAPVADVAPGVVRFGNFPVDAFAGDAIGIEPIGRRGVEELGDDVFAPGGVGEQQGFPVLEDVSPVAFVGQSSSAIGLGDSDVECIPGSTGITVAAAEPERQIFKGQSFQGEIVLVPGFLEKLRAFDPFVRIVCVEPGSMLRCPRCVSFFHESNPVSPGKPGGVGEDSASHVVEQGVHPMVGIEDAVAGALQAIGVGDDGIHRLAGGVDFRLEFRGRIVRCFEHHPEIIHLTLAAVDIGDDRPFDRFTGFQAKIGAKEICRGLPLHAMFRCAVLAAGECFGIIGGKGELRVGQADRPRDVAVQRFGRFGEVAER